MEFLDWLAGAGTTGVLLAALVFLVLGVLVVLAPIGVWFALRRLSIAHERHAAAVLHLADGLFRAVEAIDDLRDRAWPPAALEDEA